MNSSNMNLSKRPCTYIVYQFYLVLLPIILFNVFNVTYVFFLYFDPIYLSSLSILPSVPSDRGALLLSGILDDELRSPWEV